MVTFTAVTYNVLAQSFVRRDRYPLSEPEALDATRRHALLLQRLEGLDADLLCLQELEPAMNDAVRERFEASHHVAYAPRTSRPDGLAILARRAGFDWLGHDVLRFAPNRTRDGGPALIAHLSIDDTSIHVACAHLPWEPESTPPAEHLGRQQMLELIAHRDATAPHDTWIFAGDFNAVPTSVVLDAALSHGMAESCREQRPRDTCAINGRPRKIDYLLYSTGRLLARPGILARLSRDSVLPSLTEPSDHLPLHVDFEVAA
jgi:endonuclease/exonuclease/phosphatase (EEP) superfamily protein YafD